MKNPKEITMLGRKFKIIYKPKGASTFSFSKNTILINTEYKEDLEEEFIHEILEAVLIENLHRYYNNEGNSDYVFMFKHTDFCSIVKQFAHILKINKLLS